jgi:aminopeptidase
MNFQHTLQAYAELTVKVGLNLQPGQRLLIMKAPLEAAPLVREIAVSAYKAGARLVDVMWGDEELVLARFQYAPGDSFEEYPVWRAKGMEETARRGDALLSITGVSPDLLKDQDSDSVSAYQRTRWKYMGPTLEHIERNATNWTVIAASVPGWAAYARRQARPGCGRRFLRFADCAKPIRSLPGRRTPRGWPPGVTILATKDMRL